MYQRNEQTPKDYFSDENNLKKACDRITNDYWDFELVFLDAGFTTRDYRGFIQSATRGTPAAVKVYSAFKQAEKIWINRSRKKVLESGDRKAITALLKFERNKHKIAEEKRRLAEFLKDDGWI